MMDAAQRDSNEPWLIVIGLGEDGLDGVSPDVRHLVETADLLVGGARHLAMLPPSVGERLVWSRPLADSLDRIVASAGSRVVVVASGDPMSYGIGATLVRRLAAAGLDPARVMRVIPAVGSFSLAAARMLWPLADITCLSLHGRGLDHLARHLVPGRRILALTDDGVAPGAVADFLTARGWGPSRLAILERLGGPAERRFDCIAEQMGDQVFADLNLVAITAVPSPDAQPLSTVPGLPDGAYRHDGQLTKRWARAMTLASLGPMPDALLWDLGAGCGSIGIEWLRAGGGAALAVELNPERASLIAQNARTLGVPDLRVVTGASGDVLGDLPPPDAVFIGGGLDAALLDRALAALKPGGRLVANVVTLESETDLVAFHALHGGDLVRFALSRAEPVGNHHLWRAASPLTHYCLIKDGPI